jgi:DNA-binding transcriptional LysR family regulator
MQLVSLKVFCDLAETGNFTKTAQLNEVTHSAVSQQISSLERIFESRLMERGRKMSRLTRDGQVVYDYSKQILQTYELLNSKMQELKDIIAGTIRVATIYSIGLHDLPPYLKRFMKEFPTVNVHVEYRPANQIYADVLGNVVDIGLVAYPERNAGLEIIPFRKDELVLICHPQHLFAKQKGMKLKTLASQRFIGFEPDIPTRKAVDKILRAHGVEVHNAMEFDNIESLKRAVEIDAGVSIVPQETVVQEVSNQTLSAVPIDDGPFYRPLGVIYKKNKVPSPAMKQFLAMLRGRT